MNIVADESVDGQMVTMLRSAGHAVVFIAELDPGIDDEEVPRRSLEAGAVLLTADKDFGELVYRKGLRYSGIVLLRLTGLSSDKAAMYSGTGVRGVR
ncbi:MAG: DUF5615 family PIN-like protein [Bryobacterales bacterium]|nr:DUF5615 family PIN-like protein [Bryobacterales bacterium]